MSHDYPFTDDEVQQASKERKVKALHSAILLHRERLKRSQEWKIETPHSRESILVLLKIYGWELAKLDAKYFNDHLAKLPAV